MRLTLELIGGPRAGEARAIDGTTAFSVGTEHGATWVLPGDGEFARIDLQNGPDGFRAVSSGAVTIEGQPVPDGMTVKLSHGSRIGLGNAVLRAAVTAEPGRGIGGSYVNPSRPTISSILSDVTPGGDTANGLLPGRGGEEWMASITGSKSAPAKDDLSRIASFGYATRPAGKAAKPTDKPLATYLPEDWAAPGDRLNRIFQAEAASVSLRVSKDDPDPESSAAPRAVRATSTPLLAAAGVQPDAVEGDPERHLANAGAALRVALAGLGRLEQAMRQLRADLGLPMDAALNPATLAPNVVLSDAEGLCIRMLGQRIDKLEQQQRALLEGCRAYLAKMRETLDPDAIAARGADRKTMLDRLVKGSAEWASYCALWSPEAPDEVPLSGKALAREIDAMETGHDPKESDL